MSTPSVKEIMVAVDLGLLTPSEAMHIIKKKPRRA